jgi:predicted kinase
MRTILVLRGLPGCGKSTFAKELLKKEPDRWKRFNRDDLRAMVDDSRWSKDNELFIVEIQEILVKAALHAGYDVVLDNTHLVPQTINKIYKLAESIGDVKVIEKGFNVSIQECLSRNALRTGVARVPDKVIHDMARAAGLDRGKKLTDSEHYCPPLTGDSVIVQNESLPKAIICDLDGTLALIGDRSPYDASRCDELDSPNVPVIECVKAMHAQGAKIVFMSGREDKYREQTVRFIEQHCRYTCNHLDCDNVGIDEGVIPYELHMRPTGDSRKDAIVKRELFDANVANKYNVLFCLDDRDSIVLLWRTMGLSCFQVDYGNF